MYQNNSKKYFFIFFEKYGDKVQQTLIIVGKCAE